MPFASHIVKRGRMYQYVRRVPEDIADRFPYSRIQRSLRTPEKARAFEAAARVHAEVEQQFAHARRNKGATLDLTPVDDWEWPDWRLLADWFKAILIEDDWQARSRQLPGAAFDTGVTRSLFWRDSTVAQAHLDLRATLREMTISRYAEERIGYVQSIVRRLGVPVSKSSPYFERFMGACLRAELEYLTIFFDREGGRMEEAPHPDTIKGKWRKAAEQLREQRAISLGIDITKTKKAGKTLTDCFEQWKRDRQQANKKTTRHGADEKELAIEDFQKHARVRDIGEITRAHIIAFRDHLFTTGLKTPTVNKRVGQITTLLATAQRAGWIDTAITGGIYIEIPAGTNEREPFDRAELDVVFGQDVFRKGVRSENPKAGGELEFWIPLVSLTSGLISSEIIQLGPDTVVPHPDHPEIICFEVSNAGGRSIKAHARKRYVPVRKELLDDGGFLALVENARQKGWKTLWAAAEQKASVTSVSNMFSSFWSDRLRNELSIKDPLKTLYSLRHNFRDALSAAGATQDEKNQLMGHAEAGTGKKYGTKKKPRVVDIVRLNELIQSMKLPLLDRIEWPSP